MHDVQWRAILITGVFLEDTPIFNRNALAFHNLEEAFYVEVKRFEASMFCDFDFVLWPFI